MNNDGDLDALFANISVQANRLYLHTGCVFSDIGTTKTVDDPMPTEGDTIVYTLVITNTGPENTTGLQITDLLPGGVTYLSDTGGGAYTPSNGVWTIGMLNTGASTTLMITVTVDIGTSGATLLNIAMMTALDQNDPMPVEGSNIVYTLIVTKCTDGLWTIGNLKTVAVWTVGAWDWATSTGTAISTPLSRMTPVKPRIQERRPGRLYG